MGQGVMTSQAQMVAEELGVSLASIDMVLGDTDRCPLDMGTFGSLTTRMFGPVLRAAAAQARLTLLTLASRQLGVPIERLQVADGMVSVVDDPNRRVRYATLAKGAAITEIVEAKAELRQPAEFSVMGTSPARLDGREKVTGSAQYAADIRLPRMVYARLLRPAVHGATLLHAIHRPAKAMPGVVVVEHGDLVAVLHADPEAAEAALGRSARSGILRPKPRCRVSIPTRFSHTWCRRPHRSRRSANAVTSTRRRPARSGASTARSKRAMSRTRPMEPHAALACIAGGKATVWASTQTPFPLATASPPRLAWTRTMCASSLPAGWWIRGQERRQPSPRGGAARQDRGCTRSGRVDPLRGVLQRHLRSGICRHRSPRAWRPTGKFCFSITRCTRPVIAARPPTTISRIALSQHGLDALWRAATGASLHPFGVGPWRGPGASMNCFAIESQIDIMAAAAAQDPLAFRMRNLERHAHASCATGRRRCLWLAARGRTQPARRGDGVFHRRGYVCRHHDAG
jgi:nicotinate dehydrogenase subunit B